MRLNGIERTGVSNHNRVRPPKNGGNEFSRLLEGAAADGKKVSAEVNPLPASGTTLLGTISRENPTVSDLLFQHPAYRKDTWGIVHSGRNQEKPFTRMKAGTKVYIDQETREIFWDRPGRRPPADQPPETNASRTEPVALGTISREHPTVSDLLFRSPSYRKETWEIVHAENNRGKPFTRMTPGTTVYLDPESREIFWDRTPVQSTLEPQAAEAITPAPTSVSEPVVLEEDAFSEGLADAVEPYLGRPYEELDCYQLVVQGLEKLGVKYQGTGGLAEQLIKTAVSKGLPRNAYLNGEGLIRNSGSLIYSKSFPRIGRPETEARAIFDQIEPLLKKGFILSFSTPTRGHTGIISRRDGAWTYINSGNMDHQIESRVAAKGVGEEFLSKEIGNWFKLAFDRNESLQVTLGRLNEEKLRSAMI